MMAQALRGMTRLPFREERQARAAYRGSGRRTRAGREMAQDRAQRPQEQEEDPQASVSPAELAEVKAIMASFAKTGRSFKLYSRNNEMIVKFTGELYDKITAFLEKRDSLVFAIRPTQFLYSDEAVYENDDRSESFAFKLYKDGVRQLAFYQGLDKRELVDIIDIISTNFDSFQYADEDIVTLLWKHDFDKISYVVVEAFAEDVSEDEKADYKANIDAIVNLVKTDVPPENAIRSARLSVDDIVIAQQREEKDDDLLSAPPFTPSTAANIFAVAEAEFQRIAAEIQAMETQSSVDDMVEVVFEIFEQEDNVEDMNDLVEVVLQLLDTYILSGDLRRVNALLKRLRFLEKPEYAPNFRFRGVIAQIFAKLSDANRLQQIMVHLNNNTIKGAQGDVFTYFSLQDPRVVPVTLDLLAEIQAVQTRRLVVDSMILLAKGRPEHFASRLRSDKWFIVTDMLYALGKMGGERALPYLLDTFANTTHPRVRQEVVSALRKYHTPEVRQMMLTALDDGDGQVRQLALRHLANARDTSVVPILSDRMGKKEFADAALEEKKRYFTALAMIGGQQLVPFFRDHLTTRGLLNKIHLDEMRAGAATALGIVGSPEAIQILEAGIQSTNKAIRDSCTEVLRKLGRIQDGAPQT